MTSIKTAHRLISFLASVLSNREAFRLASEVLSAQEIAPAGECNFCGYKGQFLSHGRVPRPGARCPSCQSVERHRLLALAAERGEVSFSEKKILHFAPEAAITRLVNGYGPRLYHSADIEPGRADLTLNIESLELADASYDQIICSHVLEHVDDYRALAEMFRVLVPGGRLIAMVPIVEGWSVTYEDPALQSAEDRMVHYSHPDHRRYYGRDFRDRVRSAGFKITEFTAMGADSVRHRLSRGEKIFFCDKPASMQAA